MSQPADKSEVRNLTAGGPLAVEQDQTGAGRLQAQLSQQRDDLTPVVGRVIHGMLQRLQVGMDVRAPVEGCTVRVAVNFASVKASRNWHRFVSTSSHRARTSASEPRSRPWGTAGGGAPSQRVSHSCSAQTM